MQRVTNSTKKVDLYGSGKHGYTDGVPGVEAATILDSAGMNPLQEEVARAIEYGEPLDTSDLEQLIGAIHIGREIDAFLRQTFQTVGSALWRGFVGNGKGYIHAVGESAACRYSLNLGKTWSSVTVDASYAGDFVACASNGVGDTIAVGTTVIHYIQDGVPAATTQAVNDSGSVFRSVAWNGTTFCAVATKSGSKDTWTSTSIGSWTRHAAIAALAGVSFIIAGAGGLFIADNGATSPDGVTWTSHSFSGTFDCRQMSYDAVNGYIAHGYNASGFREIQRSTNGTSWAVVRTGVTASAASNDNAGALWSTHAGYYAMSNNSPSTWAGRKAKCTATRDFRIPVAYMPSSYAIVIMDRAVVVRPYAALATCMLMSGTTNAGEILTSSPFFNPV